MKIFSRKSLHVGTTGSTFTLMMNKELFIRFTNSIEADIERGTSILTESDNEVTDGLCAFYGGNTIEETHAKAQKLGKIVANSGDEYVIVRSIVNIHAKKGTMGTVIWADEIEILEKGVIK